MDLYAKKYTILVNDEPIYLSIKNGKVKKAKFMGKRVPFELDRQVVDKIKSYPTKIVNGANFEKDEAFTKPLSKMLSQQLDLAIVKRDKKIMSRFAQSDLVPVEQKDKFIEAINRKTGIRRVLNDVLNATNNLVQGLAKKIDRYFDKLNNKVANKKLDTHLEKYQQKELNRLDINAAQNYYGANIDGKLLLKAEEFMEKNEALWDEINSIKTFDEAYPPHRKALQTFLKQSVENGYTVMEAGHAFFKASEELKFQRLALKYAKTQEAIVNVESELKKYKLKEAAKNETLEDFKLLSLNKTREEKLDLLIENKEYQSLPNEKQIEFENKFIFDKASEIMDKVILNDRAKELNNIAVVANKNRYFSFTKEAVENDWKIAQAENRTHKIPSEKFMNLSAIKFNGVSKQRLENWQIQMNEMRAKGKNVPSEQKVNEFIEGSLNNAKRLEQQGFLKEKEKGEFEFVKESKKRELYQQVKNKEHQYDLKERVQDLSSDKSFEKLVRDDGSIDVEKLNLYAKKLNEIAKIAEKQQERKEKNVNIGRSEMRSDTKQLQHSQTKSRGHER